MPLDNDGMTVSSSGNLLGVKLSCKTLLNEALMNDRTL